MKKYEEKPQICSMSLTYLTWNVFAVTFSEPFYIFFIPDETIFLITLMNG